MAEDLKWVVGILFAAIAAIGGWIARDRTLTNMIRDGDGEARREAKSAADQLHERINRVRDEYAKRVDLDDHVRRVEKSVDGLREDMKAATAEQNRRLDKLIEILGGRPPL